MMVYHSFAMLEWLQTIKKTNILKHGIIISLLNIITKYKHYVELIFEVSDKLQLACKIKIILVNRFYHGYSTFKYIVTENKNEITYSQDVTNNNLEYYWCINTVPKSTIQYTTALHRSRKILFRCIHYLIL